MSILIMMRGSIRRKNWKIDDFQYALEALTADLFTEEQPDQKEEIGLTVYPDKEDYPQISISLYRYDGTDCLAVVDNQPVSLVQRIAVVKPIEAAPYDCPEINDNTTSYHLYGAVSEISRSDVAANTAYIAQSDPLKKWRNQHKASKSAVPPGERLSRIYFWSRSLNMS